MNGTVYCAYLGTFEEETGEYLCSSGGGGGGGLPACATSVQISELELRQSSNQTTASVRGNIQITPPNAMVSLSMAGNGVQQSSEVSSGEFEFTLDLRAIPPRNSSDDQYYVNASKPANCSGGGYLAGREFRIFQSEAHHNFFGPPAEYIFGNGSGVPQHFDMRLSHSVVSTVVIGSVPPGVDARRLPAISAFATLFQRPDSSFDGPLMWAAASSRGSFDTEVRHLNPVEGTPQEILFYKDVNLFIGGGTGQMYLETTLDAVTVPNIHGQPIAANPVGDQARIWLNF